jgi:predicted RNA binding protein YcfA (HicA-like mRNA interferase family)
MRIPSLSYDDVVRVLKKAGFVYAPKRGRGSHIALYKTTPSGKRLVIVPKRKDLPAGTLHAIMDQAGLSRDEFLRLLSDT